MSKSELPTRKLTRLTCFDYSQNGYYFITICSCHRNAIFSRITNIAEDGFAQNDLTPIGKAIQNQLLQLPERYPEATIDKYVIIPNHLHAIIQLHQDQIVEPHSLSQIIGAFKSLATRECRLRFSTDTLFQKSYHDHIIRNQADYSMIWSYIDANPQNWKKDCFFSDFSD